MQLVETRAGLFVAAEEASHQSVATLLRNHDDNLRLIPQTSELHQTVLWKVYRWRGPDRPAEFVCAWQTRDGLPLPLGSGIVDMVQQLDKATIGEAPDPDKLNAEHRAELAKDHRREREAIRDDHKPYIDRARVSIAPGHVTALPSWKRTRRPGGTQDQEAA